MRKQVVCTRQDFVKLKAIPDERNSYVSENNLEQLLNSSNTAVDRIVKFFFGNLTTPHLRNSL